MPKYLAFTIYCEIKSKMPKGKKKTKLKAEVPFDMYTQTSTYQFLSNVLQITLKEAMYKRVNHIKKF